MEVEDARRRWAAMAQTHRPHPVCPRCRKALYKSQTPGGTTTKRDRYRWCRNSDCPLSGRDVSDVVLIGDVLVRFAAPGDRAALAAMLEGMS